MNILELINTLDVGGAERVVTNLSLDLQARGHSVHIACLRDLGVTPVPESRFQQAGVTLEALEKADGFSFAAVGKLVNSIRRANIDVVHTHNPLVNHYGVLAARRAGVRVVVNTMHGSATLQMRALAGILFRASCLATTRVVSVCRAVAEVCRRRLPLWGGRSAVIYNGIELEPFLGIPPRRRNGAFRFGAMGRFVPVKDHASLLEAFAVAHSAEPRCELHILGWGELEDELRQRAKNLGIAGSVWFRGFSRDVAGFLADLDCFVMPSLSEGLPMAVLEAMAAGLPLIGTAVGGVAELIEDAGCGWLSTPGRPEELGKRMVQAMACGDLLEMGERARADAVAKYSVATMGRNYAALFAELLEA